MKIFSFATMGIGIAVHFAYGTRYFLYHSSMTQADYLKANWQWYLIGFSCLVAGYLMYPLRKE